MEGKRKGKVVPVL